MGIQDAGVFVSSVVSILIFLGQTVRVCQSYNAIWTSLCMLFEVVTIDLHYMTDRQKWFDLKISNLKLLRKQRHLHLQLKHTKN